MLSSQLYDKLHEATEKRENVALITITDHTKLTEVGRKFLLYTTGEIFDESETSQTFLTVLKEHCLPLLQEKKTKAITINDEGEAIECFVEVFIAPPHLIVAGAGHVSEPVAEIGKMLGFYVTVIDDRKEFANEERFHYVDEVACKSYIEFFRTVPITPETYILLLTRGHKFDVVSLQELLGREEEMLPEERTRYIGMIGSRRRIAGVFEQLKDEFTEHNFVNIYSPVGLDIGAQTPTEIAISILAEILKIKNDATGSSLKGKIKSYSLLKFRERKDKRERVKK